MKIKHSFLLIAFITLATACQKDTPTPLPEAFDATAEIFGLDAALCACCGGVVAKLDGSELEYRITEFPDSFQSVLDSMPVPFMIDFNYTENGDCNGYYYLILEEFEVL